MKLILKQENSGSQPPRRGLRFFFLISTLGCRDRALKHTKPIIAKHTEKIYILHGHFALVLGLIPRCL